MRIFIAISVCSLFASCLTQKKVNSWLDDHKTEAAGYCADKFSPDTITRTVTKNIDSAGYYDAYMNMSYLADSLFFHLDSIQHLPPGDRPKINIDSLRKIIDKEIRKRLKPCIDTVKVVTSTIIDRAREAQLKGNLEEKDKTISARDNRITELDGKVRSKNKWIWMFWALVVLIGGYTVLKIKRKLPV